MWRDIFIWKALHTAIVAVKDEQIQNLREELVAARADRLQADASRDAAIEKLIEAMTPKPAPPPPRFVRRDQTEPATPPKTLDLSEVDPNDKKAIRDIAISEMPSGKQSGTMLLQKMESIRAQAIIAQAAKRERSKEVGVLSAPESVMAKIEAAEQEGRERARVQ